MVIDVLVNGDQMPFRSMKFELQSFANELNPLQCGLRLNRAYQTLLDMNQWSFLKRSALINTVPPYIAGTVTVTTGSATVTGIGTAFTAVMAGRYFRLSTQFEFYLIQSVSVALQTLTLESAVGTGATGSTYTIFKTHYPKPANTKHIINLSRELLLAERTQEWLDSFDPDRMSTGPPIVWSNYDDATLEIYPPSDQVYVIRVYYKISVADLAAETDVPLLPENLIILHAAKAAYRQLGSKPEGQGYLKLLPGLQEEFKDAWTAAWETDMSKQSLPEQVVTDQGGAMPTSVEFTIDKDTFWSGR